MAAVRFSRRSASSIVLPTSVRPSSESITRSLSVGARFTQNESGGWVSQTKNASRAPWTLAASVPPMGRGGM